MTILQAGRLRLEQEIEFCHAFLLGCFGRFEECGRGLGTLVFNLPFLAAAGPLLFLEFPTMFSSMVV